MSSARTYKKVEKTARITQKKKSRFRKAPGAPKRFKSAYIFFSTDMMHTIKKQQKSSGSGKQKITDISKRISRAWKTLPVDERTKWDLIAKKDKERFVAEKRDYKGPWQLPIKNESQKSEFVRSRSGSDVALLTSESEDSSISWYNNENKALRRSYPDDGDSSTIESFHRSPNSAPNNAKRLSIVSQVSQEERDAAHNLVHLFRQQGSSPRSEASPQRLVGQGSAVMSHESYRRPTAESPQRLAGQGNAVMSNESYRRHMAESPQRLAGQGSVGMSNESYMRPPLHGHHPVPSPAHHAYGFY